MAGELLHGRSIRGHADEAARPADVEINGARVHFPALHQLLERGLPQDAASDGDGEHGHRSSGQEHGADHEHGKLEGESRAQHLPLLPEDLGQEGLVVEAAGGNRRFQHQRLHEGLLHLIEELGRVSRVPWPVEEVDALRDLPAETQPPGQQGPGFPWMVIDPSNRREMGPVGRRPRRTR